jgi:hypothetical protein
MKVLRVTVDEGLEMALETIQKVGSASDVLAGKPPLTLAEVTLSLINKGLAAYGAEAAAKIQNAQLPSGEQLVASLTLRQLAEAIGMPDLAAARAANAAQKATADEAYAMAKNFLAAVKGLTMDSVHFEIRSVAQLEQTIDGVRQQFTTMGASGSLALIVGIIDDRVALPPITQAPIPGVQ